MIGALELLRASGWAAALLLVAALAMTPIARFWRDAAPRAVRARRWLGIACASLALVHGALATSTYLGWSGAWGALVAVPWLRSGGLALALLAPLLVTSFPSATRALRARLWKPLHRLAYAAAALTLHHLLLAPFAPRAWGITLAAVLFGLAVLRLSPHRRTSEDQRRTPAVELADRAPR